MKVLAINSSPRAGKGSKTDMMLTALVQGMREEGADVEVVNLREKSVKRCVGCYTCWTKTPGQCLFKDDMTKDLFPKWLAADVVVYASPLYFHTMNSAMAGFIERTLPARLPFFRQNEDGKTTHPLRFKTPAVVTLTVCGFPELSEFDGLKAFMEKTRHQDETYIADIMRPAAEHMTIPFLRAVKTDILDATHQAGRQIVSSRQIDAETMARIQQPLVDVALFAQLGNLYWNTCIAEGVTPKAFAEKKMVPRPDSIDSFMTLFPAGLNTGAAGERQVLLQFNFSGQQPGVCHFLIEKKRIAAMHGASDHPDITIDTPFELWMDIMTGKVDPQQMFIDQRYTVQGDFEMMLQLFQKSA